MPMIRQKLNAHKFFDAMKDERLSMKARGVLATLQAMDVGKHFTLEEIAEHVPDSYPVILSNVRELEKLGYLERRRVYGEDGYMTGTEYLLFNDQGLQ